MAAWAPEEIRAGYTVRAFHPGMFGVVCTGTVLGVGPKWVRVDFGIRGVARVPRRDVVEVTDIRAR